MNRLDLIQQIVAIEWSQFSQVQNLGGPADCQSNLATFCAMRTIQASIWQYETLKSYLEDLQIANSKSHNLMTEKYGRMMATTHPDEYLRIKDYFPAIAVEKLQILDQIMAIFIGWEKEAMDTVASNDIASFQPETASVYLGNELSTYSMKTLTLCLIDVHEAFKIGRNLVKEILEKTLEYYQSLGIDSVVSSQKIGNRQLFEVTNCVSCGIDVPINSSISLSQVADELLDYELPEFYDEDR